MKTIIKKSILVIPILFLLNSCFENKVNPEPSSFLVFFPREVNHLWVSPVNTEPFEHDGISSLLYTELSQEGSKATDIRLLVFTSNISTLQGNFPFFEFAPYQSQQDLPESEQQLDERNVELEKQLESDYRSKPTPKKTNLEFDTPISLEYRTTGIKDITITCDQTLFGKAAGQDLKEHFYLYRLDPQQVISSTTKQLVFGYSDNLNEMSIEEWLQMKPMAQPSMHLALRDTPSELPATVIFTVTMTTDDNREIVSSSEEVKLIQ